MSEIVNFSPLRAFRRDLSVRALIEYFPGMVLFPDEMTFGRRYVNERLMDWSLLTFGRTALQIGPEGAGWYEDTYTYTNAAFALSNFLHWDGHTEPEGWIRHQPSGRRRPDGDKTREYVRD